MGMEVGNFLLFIKNGNSMKISPGIHLSRRSSYLGLWFILFTKKNIFQEQLCFFLYHAVVQSTKSGNWARDTLPQKCY